jgi:glutathione synthase/RimK-type ligase-like ATP-grasp enzyme/gamma-glutamyl:cysteine ligase YbdK (ATP-grasp superfamily)
MSSSRTLVVVTDRKDLGPCKDLRVVDVETYLAGGADVAPPGYTVVNLCRSQRYLSRGYYVSLLADARGQTPLPTVETLEGMQHPNVLFRALAESGVEVLQAHELAARLRTEGAPRVPREGPWSPGEPPPLLKDYDKNDDPFFRLPEPAELTEVLVCVGRCDVPGFQRLAGRVYRAWPTPLLRMKLLREDDRWKLYDLMSEKLASLSEAERAQLVRALSIARVPEDERGDRRKPSIAVLYDERDPFKASSPETVDRLTRIAAARGIRVQRIGPSDVARLGEHDALFIRTVTGLDKPSFRFAARAEALGQPVIDDPRSIIRCSNKIFLFELMKREGIPSPPTVVFDRSSSFAELERQLGTPYIVKLPDGSFSGGVFKVQTAEDHAARAEALLRRSPLLVAQAYLPTSFDWRVTVLDGRPLFVCKYHMAPGHWQIRQMTPVGARYGRVDAVPRDKAPAEVVRVGCRAAKLVGDGLYGVDLKETPSGVVVIEVNDNPNMDTGYDDAADGDVVFEDLVTWFEKRLPKDRQEPTPVPRKPRRADTPENHALEALREPIGRPPRKIPGKTYSAYEVVGLELEYPVVDRDLNALPIVEELMTFLAGRPTSDLDLGLVGFSNEIFDHVMEVKTPVPLASLQKTEEVLVEGIRRLSVALEARFGARLLPCGMHPWFDPQRARMWTRSNRKIYQTYARLFDVHTHGWANVQASHVNLPVGREDEAVAMMNAAAMLVPYLPAIAASSPMFDGELQPAVDNRLGWIIEHQARLPESSGRIVPEPIENLTAYRRDVLKRMYTALDALPDSDAIRHEFLNARGAVFKFSRDAMEVRVLDVQECVKMDVAIACFVRLALRSLSTQLAAGKLRVPDHDLLVADFHAVVRAGTGARVAAPHLAAGVPRDDDGKVEVRAVLRDLMAQVKRRPKGDDAPYLALIEGVIERGSLSECMQRALLPHVDDPGDGFTQAARVVYRQLSECLVENRPWEGRGL